MPDPSRILSLLLVALAACGSRAEPPRAAAADASPPTLAAIDAGVVDEAAATAAYASKAYAPCAAQWTELARRAPGTAKANDALYNAACCHALDGKADLAFAALEASVAGGLRDLEHLQKDTDLVSLHADPRWARLVASIETARAEWLKALKEPALRLELLALVEDDQAARKAMIASGSPANLKAVEDIDIRTTRRMKAVIAKHGWPGKTLIGEDGAHSAWLLVQHADKDPAFQKDCLARMEALLASGEVTEVDYAYLYDRVAVAEKRPQRYGTQFNNQREPQPIEDEAHVDERRQAIGLGSMAEYRQRMLQRYGAPPDAGP